MKKAFSILSLILLLFQAAAFGQDVSQPDFKTAFDQANIVILGKVMDVQSNWISSGYKIVFEVEKSWKRPTEKYITLNVKPENYQPGMFAKGSAYLVYAEKKFNLQTGLGYRYFDSAAAGADLTLLGEGLPPSQSPGAKNLPYIMTAMTILGLALVLFVVKRKKKS
ncbi:MAG: hypothetical protein H6581_09400 [Bacteroidia bacterium]|nr:hypothetical protein [Bacteroidia bacterium]